jgi:hypothetical protein
VNYDSGSQSTVEEDEDEDNEVGGLNTTPKVLVF